MGRKLPALKPAEVCRNLEGLGFKFKRQVGTHAHYERLADNKMQRKVVTVDMGRKGGFSKDLMKSMIRQSGFSPEEFCSGMARP
jgi:predicted RNA binding protein YcfA (HicA-like mRNA interferase family)